MVNNFSRMLAEGDLRSDGFANEVVQIVSEHPALLPDLMEALVSPDPSVRGHAADALEKVSRSLPEEVTAFLPRILRSALDDPVAMVRWHLAMVLGHLSAVAKDPSEIRKTLLALLKDDSAFVRSWAITSLCILGRNSPDDVERIASGIARLVADPSAAVSKRARTALRVLADPDAPFPKTWGKSTHSTLSN